MDKVKYDLKASKEVIGPLYPRLLDKQGREIDGFHREEADSEWPTTQLEHIDTDVKYWVARITANTHRRRVEPGERQEEIIELAKALRDEEQEGIRKYSPSLVNTIAELTTFSIQHIGNLLKNHPEFKERPGAGGPSGVKPSLTSEQTSKRKSREQTGVEEKLKNLYNKVEKSVITGQGNFSQYINKAKSLDLNVENYEIELKKLKDCLRDSVGRRYEDVKGILNEGYNRSVEMKKTLSQQIKAEEKRRDKVNEELRKDPNFRKEVAEEAKNQARALIIAARYIPDPVETPPFPEGKYRCIIVDPPWPMEKSERIERPNQGNHLDYPTWTIEKIKSLPIPELADSTRGCQIYLWTTNSFLLEAFNLFEYWNVKYNVLLVWVKPTGMTPFGWMRNAEFVLFGYIGPFEMKQMGLKQVFEAPVEFHSRKPDVFYELVKQASPALDGERLDMFYGKIHLGFEPWGVTHEQR